MDHIFHSLELLAPTIGIGLDWDGGGGVRGLQDVSTAKITAALQQADISQQTIKDLGAICCACCNRPRP